MWMTDLGFFLKGTHLLRHREEQRMLCWLPLTRCLTGGMSRRDIVCWKEELTMMRFTISHPSIIFRWVSLMLFGSNYISMDYMNRKWNSLLPVMAFVLLSGLQIGGNTAFAQGQGMGQRSSLPEIPIKGDTTRTLSRYFIEGSAATKAPAANGFIQRWLVLEPVKESVSRNNIVTDKYLRTTFSTDNFSDNFNLFHYTYAINKTNFGILVWLVTVINCPEEIKDVRMTAGCNSASMWWLNGQEAMILSGDRDMIADNVTSDRLTLKKGKNIVRGAVINGPGMANFCVRFIDEKGLPVKNYTISYE